MSSERCCIVIEVPPPKVKRPVIVRYKGIERGFRVGRGYSIGEIRAAGLNLKLAKYLNIPIDPRRRSIHNENVESLKKFIEMVRELIEAKKAKPARMVTTIRA
jgi:large subunit ribosomal protein L13e